MSQILVEYIVIFLVCLIIGGLIGLALWRLK